jgi:serine/threonine protein kinase
MNYTRLVVSLILIRAIEPICESTKEERAFMDAFFASDDKDFVRNEVLGVVKRFKHNDIEYEVKEVVFKPSPKIEEMRIDLDDDAKKRFDKFAGEYRISSFKVDENYDDSKDIGQKYSKEIEYFNESLTRELSIIKKVSKNKRIDEVNSLKFRFCAKYDRSTYLLVFEEHGEDLGSKDSLTFFNDATELKKLETYLKITYLLHQIQEGGVYHCNLQRSKIVWRDEIGGEMAIVDYGRGSFYQCRLGTEGFNAPELFKADSRGLTSGRKKDIYSIAMLFADIHFKASASDFDPVAEQANYERENSLLDNHHKLLANLQKAVSESNKSSEKMDQLRTKTPEELFVDCITKMMNPDPEKRDNALVVYKDLWLIYQLSKYSTNDSEAARSNKIQTIQRIVKNAQVPRLHSIRHDNIEFFENIPIL